MEAISFLTDWSKYLAGIIVVATPVAVGYFALRKSLSFRDHIAENYNGKIINTIKGAVVGVAIAGIVALVKSYFM